MRKNKLKKVLSVAMALTVCTGLTQIPMMHANASSVVEHQELRSAKIGTGEIIEIPNPQTAVTVDSNYTQSNFTPADIINGSGMSDVNDSVKTLDATCNTGGFWHANDDGKTKMVQVDLGATYQLDEMWIWNMNQFSDGVSYSNRGFKNVKIEYSVDKGEWTELQPEGITFLASTTVEYPFQFTQADGSAAMPATNLNDGQKSPVSFHGVNARHVRITADPGADGSWGGAPYSGLTELRFTKVADSSEVKEENVLRNRPFEFTGAEINSAYPLTNVNDGNKNTRIVTTSSEKELVFDFTLDGYKRIDRAEFYDYYESTWCPTSRIESISVQIPDENEENGWKTVITKNGEYQYESVNGPEGYAYMGFDFEPVVTDKVRVITTAVAENNCPTIWEIEVYGVDETLELGNSNNVEATIPATVYSEKDGIMMTKVGADALNSAGYTTIAYPTTARTYDHDNDSETPEHGYLFAGWYKDAKGKEAFTSVPTGTEDAYAKFVDVNVLSVKGQILADTTEDSEESTIRFVSTIDECLDYKEVGFTVSYYIGEEQYGGTYSATTVFSDLVAVGGEGDAMELNAKESFANQASAYFFAYSIKGVPNEYFGTEFDVTPYWVTKDGTKVTGVQRNTNLSVTYGINNSGTIQPYSL